MIMNMEDNISVIKGIGEKTEKLFNKLLLHLFLQYYFILFIRNNQEKIRNFTHYTKRMLTFVNFMTIIP